MERRETRLRSFSTGLLGAMLALTFTLTGCGPSEKDLASGKVRADLAAQQSTVVASFKGSSGCTKGLTALEKWKSDNAKAIDASDAWWNALSEGTKDDLYDEFPAFRQANKDRAALLIRCGSDRSLWDPSA